MMFFASTCKREQLLPLLWLNKFADMTAFRSMQFNDVMRTVKIPNIAEWLPVVPLLVQYYCFSPARVAWFFFSTYTGMVYIHSTTKAIRLQCLFRIEIFFPTSSLTFALLQKVLDYVAWLSPSKLAKDFILLMLKVCFHSAHCLWSTM